MAKFNYQKAIAILTERTEEILGGKISAALQQTEVFEKRIGPVLKQYFARRKKIQDRFNKITISRPGVVARAEVKNAKGSGKKPRK